MAEDINVQFSIEKGRAGAPRIVEALRAEDKHVSRKRVAKLMRQWGLRAKAAKKFKATTNSNHNLPVAENLLAQTLKQSVQIKSTSQILPIFGRTKAGCIWRLLWIFILAWSSAGQCMNG